MELILLYIFYLKIWKLCGINRAIHFCIQEVGVFAELILSYIFVFKELETLRN